MKNPIFYICFLLTGVTVSAQNNSPDIYRVANSSEILLHDNVYRFIFQEIESKICNKDWEISKRPLLLAARPSEKVVIINYLKGVGNIPVFMETGGQLI